MLALSGFVAVNETKNLLGTLKRCLRARGMTYHKLGRALGLSESSVKRLFSDESFTLVRLERVCAAIDMSVADLVRMAAGTREAQTFSLSLEQERTLASDASLLALFYLLLNGRSVEAAERRLGLNPRAMRALLDRLVGAQLIDIDVKRRIHLHARLPIAWLRMGRCVSYMSARCGRSFCRARSPAAARRCRFIRRSCRRRRSRPARGTATQHPRSCGPSAPTTPMNANGPSPSG